MLGGAIPEGEGRHGLAVLVLGGGHGAGHIAVVAGDGVNLRVQLYVSQDNAVVTGGVVLVSVSSDILGLYRASAVLGKVGTSHSRELARVILHKDHGVVRDSLAVNLALARVVDILASHNLVKAGLVGIGSLSLGQDILALLDLVGHQIANIGAAGGSIILDISGNHLGGAVGKEQLGLLAVDILVGVHDQSVILQLVAGGDNLGLHDVAVEHSSLHGAVQSQILVGSGGNIVVPGTVNADGVALGGLDLALDRLSQDISIGVIHGVGGVALDDIVVLGHVVVSVHVLKLNIGVNIGVEGLLAHVGHLGGGEGDVNNGVDLAVVVIVVSLHSGGLVAAHIQAVNQLTGVESGGGHIAVHLVGGAVNLDLIIAESTNLTSSALHDQGAVGGGIDAVHILAVLIQNLDLLADQVAVVTLDLGVLALGGDAVHVQGVSALAVLLHVGQHSVAVGDQGQVLVAHGLVGVLGHGVLAVNILGLLLQAVLASIKRSGATVRLLQSVDSILTAVVDGAVQSLDGIVNRAVLDLDNPHALGAGHDGLGAGVAVLAGGVVASGVQLNHVGVQSIVDHLGGIVTGQQGVGVQIGQFLVKTVLVGQHVGVDGPVVAHQAGLLGAVAQHAQQHLGGLGGAHGAGRIKLVVAAASDDAVGGAVLNVGLCPGTLDVGKGGGVLDAQHGIHTAVDGDAEHLGHLGTGHVAGGVKVAAVFLTIDDAQGSHGRNGVLVYDLIRIGEIARVHRAGTNTHHAHEHDGGQSQAESPLEVSHVWNSSF